MVSFPLERRSHRSKSSSSLFPQFLFLFSYSKLRGVWQRLHHSHTSLPPWAAPQPLFLFQTYPEDSANTEQLICCPGPPETEICPSLKLKTFIKVRDTYLGNGNKMRDVLLH